MGKEWRAGCEGRIGSGADRVWCGSHVEKGGKGVTYKISRGVPTYGL